MLTPKVLLLLALLVVTVGYLATWYAAVRRRPAAARPAEMVPAHPWLHPAVGFLTNFFDTLGISSFATTTSAYRLWKLVPDALIPGTLNVGHTLPTVAQALIYITIVQVDFRTLLLLIASSVIGSWIGAGVVVRLPRRPIQLGMGVALAAAGVLMTMSAAKLMPGGGEALALTGTKLIVACGINFVLGALMTLGIGLYAPCMIMVSLLGMNPTAAFPIMMGSCAFLMPTASARFTRLGRYDLKAALGLALGGVPAVLIAAYIVQSLPLDWARWLVVVVVLYTAATLLRAGRDQAAATP